MRKIVQVLLFLLFAAYTSSAWGLDAPAITAAAKGPNQINLTWSEVADPGYGYKIEIQSANDSRYSSWTAIATIPYWVTESHYKDPQDNTASQYPVFSLRNNTSYSFRVRSYKGDTSPAYSTYSNTATTTTRNYTAYYVNSTSGTNNSTCGTLASPCSTINYAINTRDLGFSGRVIIISSGNYASDYIRPVRSGSAGVDNKIVIMAEPGSAVNITSSSNIPISLSYNYVVIDGITVTSDYNDNMVAVTGSYNALANCEFDGSGNVSWGPWIGGSYNLVHGVYSHDFGSVSDQTSGSCMAVGGVVGADYNIIQFSTFRRGGHDTTLNLNGADYNQWMNNIMDGGWGLGWEAVSNAGAACTYNLFEGNTVKDVAKNYIGNVYKPGIEISGDYNTVRRNLIYDGNRTGTNSDPAPGIEISRLSGYGAHHNLIYNNTIYYNGGRAIVFMDGASQNDNIIANNIMYYNYGDTTYCANSLNVHIRGVTTNTVVHHNQILYKDWTTGIENSNQANMMLYSNTCMSLATSESTYGATFYNNVTATPNFVSEGSDFHLNSTSQLVNAGQVVIDSTWGTLSYKGSAPDIGAYEGDGGPPVPVLQFSSATYDVSEAGTTATITVTRSGSSTGAVSVGYATSNGTATAGDYTAASGTLSWTDGDAASKTFTVSITNDTANESDETINLTLSNPGGGAILGSQSTATLTILNDDGTNTLQFSSSSYSVNENGVTATIRVTRTNSSAGVVGVSYATSNGTATAGSDYTAASGTLSWADGVTAARTFTVSIANDTAVEGNETINLTLTNPIGNAVIGSRSTTRLTITDDDSNPDPNPNPNPNPNPDSNITTNSSAGDAEVSGGGCGFVKDDNGKGPRAKGEGLSLMIMLIMTLAGIAVARRTSLLKNSTPYKTF